MIDLIPLSIAKLKRQRGGMSRACMNNESEEICGGYLCGYPNPVISVKSALFSADSANPRSAS